MGYRLSETFARRVVYFQVSFSSASSAGFIPKFKVVFGSFFSQRAPPHQIGDATLPRSDPNLSAPDKGEIFRLFPSYQVPECSPVRLEEKQLRGIPLQTSTSHKFNIFSSIL